MEDGIRELILARRALSVATDWIDRAEERIARNARRELMPKHPGKKKTVQHGRTAKPVPQSAPPPAGMPPGGKKKGKK